MVKEECNMNPVEFSRLATYLFKEHSDIFYDKMVNLAKLSGVKPTKIQLCILSHESAAFIAYFYHLLLRYISIDSSFDDEAILKTTRIFVSLGVDFCKSKPKPLFSSLPKSIKYLLQRFTDYESAAFSEKYCSQHLLAFLSDEEASSLSELPLNQVVSVFCEFISQSLSDKRTTPVDYKKEVQAFVITDLFHTNVVSSYANVVHNLADDFISIILSKTLSKEEISDLYHTPAFINRSES